MRSQASRRSLALAWLAALLAAIPIGGAAGAAEEPAAPAFAVGDMVEVEWRGNWYKSKIVKLEPGKYFIHYDGWSEGWDEWVPPARVRKITTVDPSAPVVADYRVGEKVLLESRGNWTAATIVKVENGKFRVHPDAFVSDIWDEWVEPARLRRAAPVEPKPADPAVVDPAPADGGAPLPAGDGGLSGLYLRYEVKRPQLHYLFHPDGRVYYGVPPGGLEQFDWDQAAVAEPARMGRYSIAGDQIHFKGANGTVTSVRFGRRDNGWLTFGSAYGVPVRKIPAGTMLVGHFSGLKSAESSTAETTVARWIEFRQDGTYAAGSMALLVGAAGDENVVATAADRVSGQYQIAGNTLWLTPDGGARVGLTVYPVGDAGKPITVINISAFVYTLQP